LAVSTASNVLSHITSDGLDVWSSRGSSIIVDNLVTREESQSVRVVCERVDGSEDVLEVDGVVGWCWSGSVERVERCVDIEHQVHVCSCQCCHASIVVSCVVDSVDTDGVQAKLREFSDVTRAGCLISQRVHELRRSSRLVVDAANIESVVPLEESWKMLVAN
jgi:hypothetical protein